MKRLSLVAVVVFFAFAVLARSSGHCSDETELWTVEVEGLSIIKGGDMVQARANALADALRTAVAQVVARQLSHKTMENKGKVLKNTIYAKAESYIQTYKILGEYPSQDGYRVKARVTVSVGDVMGDLAALNLLDGEGSGVSPTVITLVVKGIGSYGDYIRIKELLKSGLKGVRQVSQKRVARGMADLHLAFAGTIQFLADQLKETGLFRLDKIDAADGRIEVTYGGERFNE
jgi:hypothetical protein